jgi:Transposase DDE domain group 1
VKRNRRFRRVKVTADGEGLVSRAGVALLRELTVDTGLADGWTDVLLDTYKAAPAAHLPGRVLADLAVVIADGGDALAHLATLRDQDKLFGTVASDATAWRCVERVTTSIWCGCRPFARLRGNGPGPLAPVLICATGW